MQEMFRKIASWLFLIGILVAVVVGVLTHQYFTTETTVGDITTTNIEYPLAVTLTLAALGFVVGILSFFAIGNITKDRIPTFLIAALILVGLGAATSTQWFANLDIVGTYFQNIAGTLAIFAAPAAGLLAIRAIWDAGKTEELEKVIPKVPK